MQSDAEKEQQAQKNKSRAEAEAARAEEEKRAEEAHREQVGEKSDEQNDDKQASQQAVAAPSEDLPPMDEQALSREQWLKRIPDDPGGLLKRKFKYYYKRKQYDVPQQQPW